MFKKIKNYIEEKRDKKTNGCGPWFLPSILRNRFYSSACNIHDLKYGEIESGNGTKKAKNTAKNAQISADNEFFDNMSKELEKRSQNGNMSLICQVYRGFQIYFFYYSVKITGGIYLRFLKFNKK